MYKYFTLKSGERTGDNKTFDHKEELDNYIKSIKYAKEIFFSQNSFFNIMDNDDIWKVVSFVINNDKTDPHILAYIGRKNCK